MKKNFLFLAILGLLFSSYATHAQDSNDQKAADAAQKKAKVVQDKARLAQDEAKAAQEENKIAQDQTKDLMNQINDMSEYDEIIIRSKKPDVNKKLTIEIKDNKVMVNGKPIESFEDDAIVVHIRKPMRYHLATPNSPFRHPGNPWMPENGNTINGPQGMSLPFLGVMTEKSGEGNGTRVISITDNSAAAKAGLKKDDIITKVNDKPIADHQQLTEAISELKPGDQISLTYTRDGKESKTSAVLGKRPATTMYQRQYLDPNHPEAGAAPLPPNPSHGINFDELGDRFGRAFGQDSKPRIGIHVQDTDDGKGVKVLEVDEGSAAGKAGIKADDIITSFNGKTVNSATDLAEESRASKDKSSVKVQLNRSGKSREIELKIPKKLRTANL